MADEVVDPAAVAKAAVVEAKLEAVKEAAKVETAAVNTLAEALKQEKAEVEKEAVAWYEGRPGWLKLLILVAVLAVFFVGQKYVSPLLSPAVNVQVVVPAPTPAVVGSAATEADKAAVERLDGLRLLARLLRHQTQKELQETGVEGKKLTKEQAVALADNFEDQHLVTIAQMSGAFPAEGKLLDTVTAVLTWVLQNKEAIKKIVELIITLLAAFA